MTLPTRAEWYIVRFQRLKTMLETYLQLMGLLRFYQPVLRLCYPVILWCIHVFCRLTSLLSDLEHSFPFFLFFEYMFPVCLVAWIGLSLLLHGVNFEFLHCLLWIGYNAIAFLFSYTSEETSETWVELVFQTLVILLPQVVWFLGRNSSATDFLYQAEFEGCRCYDQRDSVRISVNMKTLGDSNSSVRIEEDLTCFECFCSGEINLGGIDPDIQLRLLNIIQQKIDEGSIPVDLAEFSVCDSCRQPRGIKDRSASSVESIKKLFEHKDKKCEEKITYVNIEFSIETKAGFEFHSKETAQVKTEIVLADRKHVENNFEVYTELNNAAKPNDKCEDEDESTENNLKDVNKSTKTAPEINEELLDITEDDDIITEMAEDKVEDVIEAKRVLADCVKSQETRRRVCSRSECGKIALQKCSR